MTSLANDAARASTVVDNSSNLFLDALVSGKTKSGSSGVSSAGTLNIYAYATVDGGSNYTEGATGTDAAITLTNPPNLKLVGIVNVVANSTAYKFGPFSVAAAFGGTLPEKWGLVVENKTGAALTATAGDHAAVYQGVCGSYT